MDNGSAEVTQLERQQLLVVQRATFWHRVRFGFVGRATRQAGASSVVDIGAGSGVLGEWLRSAHVGVDYWFAESSPHLVAGLRATFGVDREVRIGDALPGRSIVAMLDVIEHIADDVEALRAVAGSMDDSSILVVTVPALPSLFSPWDTALGHHRRYTRRSLRASLESAGLHVHRIHYLFPELLPIALLRRVRPSDGSSADFPMLPRWVDRLGGLVSGVSAGMGRLWPAGTSLVAVATTVGRR